MSKIICDYCRREASEVMSHGVSGTSICIDCSISTATVFAKHLELKEAALKLSTIKGYPDVKNDDDGCICPACMLSRLQQASGISYISGDEDVGSDRVLN